MIAVTGATGHLGRLVIHHLRRSTPADRIVAAVRTRAKAQDLAADGIAVREADYSKPDTLAKAFAGVDRLLLISSNEVGQRTAHHIAAIDAAKQAGVRLLAYTSILHADTSGLLLAADHIATEAHLLRCGIPYVLLRNGWYFENQTAGLGAAIAHGVLLGDSGQGRFSSAARADFAEAAAAVLVSDGHENRTYELAGDAGYTREELAAEVSRQSGRPVRYQDLAQAEYETALSRFLPPDLARALADAESKAAHGALEDNSRTLSTLIGHPTTTLAAAVAAALQA